MITLSALTNATESLQYICDDPRLTGSVEDWQLFNCAVIGSIFRLVPGRLFAQSFLRIYFRFSSKSGKKGTQFPFGDFWGSRE